MSDKINSIFDLDEYEPFRERWEMRIRELKRRESYYDGSIYNKVKHDLVQLVGSYADQLYRGVKPLYLPLARAVDIDVGIIPGGWTLSEDASDDQREAMDTIFDWSRWGVDGVLYVHYGAQTGVSGLKVSDLRKRGRVVIKPVDPLRFMLVQGAFEDTPEMSFYVEMRTDGMGNDFEYAEVITKEVIRTYRNGQPEGYSLEPEYPNEVGFVPYVEVRHIETGRAFGECTFQKAIPVLDEVNQLASYLADIIAKHAEPQWAVIGAEASDLFKSGDSVWFIPVGGKAEPLVARIDISGVLAFIQEIAANVKEALPELSFDDLREKSQIATATLELQLMELVLKIKRCRPNYDSGLVQALQMAGMAALTMGIGELGVLADDDLEINPKRAILPLDPMTAIELEMQELALERERAGGIYEGFGGSPNL